MPLGFFVLLGMIYQQQMEDADILREQAQILWDRAYRSQMNGELSEAILLYKRSIDVFPTAEAFTFMGWTYSMIKQYDHAIELCKKAIQIDPAYGNPYNDIGVYLIELDRWQEAISWFEEATAAPRYAAPQFPYMNLGRVYEHLGDTPRALVYYEQALQLAPLYLPAVWAKNALLGKLN